MHRAHVVLIAVLAFGLALGLGFAGGAVAENPQTASVSELDCEYPIEVTDATGETVTIEEEPEEVVVLGASDAQTVWALDAREKVTGMPIFDATAYLDDRDDRTNVVDELGFPVVEEVVDLEPDLVLAASAMPPEDVESIREAGLTIYYAPPESSLDDVYTNIERTGQLVGKCDEAREIVDEMQGTVSAIEQAVEDEEPVTVYYAMGGGWTAGDGTVEDHMIRIAGGENVAHADDVEFYGEISEEVVVAEDPDWLVMVEGTEIPGEAAQTTAAQEDQIVWVDSNAISQPGPRMMEPIEAMAEAFHPEAIEGIDDETENGVDDTDDADDTAETDDADDAVETDDADDAVETDDADDTIETDDTADADDDGTGLTVVAAVLALSALALFARRR